MVKNFIKKPRTVTAIKYNGFNWKECIEFIIGFKLPCHIERPGIDLYIANIVAIPGEWIVMDNKGHISVCTENDFKKEYDEVDNRELRDEAVVDDFSTIGFCDSDQTAIDDCLRNGEARDGTVWVRWIDVERMLCNLYLDDEENE